MASDDFAWAMDMTEEYMTELFKHLQGNPDGPQTVAMLLALQEQMRSIPQLHAALAEQVLKAIGRIGVQVPITGTNLSPASKTESAGHAPRPSGTSAVVNTSTGASTTESTRVRKKTNGSS
jgi:hypothetical protein